jgi:hypothetical protein
MKLSHLHLGILLLFSPFCFANCDESPGKAHKPTAGAAQDTTKPGNTPKAENPFEGLRKMAFSLTPEQLQLSLPADKTVVYGVIMDWGMDDVTATVVSYQTGDASLYLSSGGGVIGGGQHEKVNKAAREFVSLAQPYLNKAHKTESTPVGRDNEVKFYLLTNKGIYAGQDVMKNFENNTSAWLPLFEQGNKVLTELRLKAER